MSLRSRFALALVAAVVAVLVGVLSYRAAEARITAEIDHSLRTATVVLAATAGLGQGDEPDNHEHDGHGTVGRAGPRMVAQAVAPRCAVVTTNRSSPCTWRRWLIRRPNGCADAPAGR